MVIQLDISTRDAWRILGIVATIAALVTLLYLAGKALGALLIAVFLAAAVHAPVTFLASKIPFGGRKLAAVLVYILTVLSMGFVVAFIVPLIINEGRDLIARLPGYLEPPETEILNGFFDWLTAYVQLFILNAIEGIVFSAEATLTFALDVIGNIVYLLFTIAISFTMAVEAPRTLQSIDSLLPKPVRVHVRELRKRMFKAVSGFVTGQVLITTLAATLTFVLLTLLGLPAPLSLAATIWLTGLIPLIGNTLGAVIVVVVALSQSLFMALFLAVYYVVYQQVENNVLEPVIQSRTVRLTPLTVLVSAIIGIRLAGFAGALLAIPAGACLRIAFEYFIEIRKAGQPANEARP